MSLRATLAGAAVLPLLLAGCTGAATTTKGHSVVSHSNVDVDTPALRAAKKLAGIEDCTRGTGTTSSTIPHLTLPCLGGGPDVNLAQLKGPLVINLFAQWCAPCREELPFYQQLHQKADGKVKVLGIDWLDTQPAQALDLVKQSGVTFPLLADPGGDLRRPWRIHALPGVVFVDKDGTVTDVELVVIKSYDELTALVKKHLGVSL